MNILDVSPAFIDETNRDKNDAHSREEKSVFEGTMKEVDMVIPGRAGEANVRDEVGVDSGDQGEACKPSGSSLIRLMSTPSRILYSQTRSSQNM